MIDSAFDILSSSIFDPRFFEVGVYLLGVWRLGSFCVAMGEYLVLADRRTRPELPR